MDNTLEYVAYPASAPRHWPLPDAEPERPAARERNAAMAALLAAGFASILALARTRPSEPPPSPAPAPAVPATEEPAGFIAPEPLAAFDPGGRVAQPAEQALLPWLLERSVPVAEPQDPGASLSPG